MTTFITHTAPPDRASVRHHVSARHIATPRKQLNRSVALRRFFAVLTSRKIRFSTRVRGGVTKLRRSCDPMQPVCVHREPRGRRRTELCTRDLRTRGSIPSDTAMRAPTLPPEGGQRAFRLVRRLNLITSCCHP